MALISIERYFLVFHHVLLNRHRFFLLTPVFICIVYPVIYHAAAIYGSWWCIYNVNYSVLICGTPCYVIQSSVYLVVSVVVLRAFPVITTCSVNLVLIIAVFKQKAKMQRTLVWRKNIRMLVRLLSIAVLYLTVWVPISVLFLLVTFGSEGMQILAGQLLYICFNNFTAFISLLYPFMMLMSIPPLHAKTKEGFRLVQRILLSFCQRRPNIIAPSMVLQTR